jgi:hypothetical protein
MRAYLAAMVSARIDELDTRADKDYALVPRHRRHLAESDWFDVIRSGASTTTASKIQEDSLTAKVPDNTNGRVSSTPRYMG